MASARLQLDAAPREDRSMHDVSQEFGKLNRNAPVELAQFAFLIGNWNFEARVKIANRQPNAFKGTWQGRYILDGYAISDEYRMTDLSGKLIVIGLNLRTYDASKRTWNIKWLNALTGTWMNLAPSELGGVRSDGRSMIYAFKETAPLDTAHAYTRVIYTKVSESEFTWRGEKSADGNAWSEFMVVECHRSKA
jgi:Protein of unknown function (DUF1579)